MLRAAARAGVEVIPWGGGTSVTGGVTVVPGDAPVVSRTSPRSPGSRAWTTTSGLATFGAGTAGPALEAALEPHGFTLGHFPQSFELSTLGGWIATRASGQESLGYGSIEDLVAGLELVAPAGRLALPAMPASAAGPDLRQLVLGSEGRLGVVTRATVRVRRRPETLRAAGTLMPSWEAGLAAARALVRERVPLTLLRLSDEPETEVGLAVGLGGARWLRPLLGGYLRLRGLHGGWGCLLLAGAAGIGAAVDLDASTGPARCSGATAASPWASAPGATGCATASATPTCATPCSTGASPPTPWRPRRPGPGCRRWPTRCGGRSPARSPRDGERVAVLCHVSHPYPDGSSLYFTLFFRCPRGPGRRGRALGDDQARRHRGARGGRRHRLPPPRRRHLARALDSAEVGAGRAPPAGGRRGDPRPGRRPQPPRAARPGGPIGDLTPSCSIPSGVSTRWPASTSRSTW